MKKIYAVIDFKGVIKLFFILGVFALLSGCFVSADDGYECGLHDMQDEMPGLAMFRGDDPGGSIERAIGNYEHALHQNEISKSHAGFCIGEILRSHDKNEEAIDWFNKAIEADQTRYEPYFARAMAFHAIQECHQSLDDLMAAESHGAEGYGLTYNRAKVRIDCGEYREALSDLDSASDYFSGGDSPIDLSFAYAEAYSGVKDFDMARNHASKVVGRLSEMENCDPQHGFCSSPRLIEAVDLLADVLCKMSREKEANDLYASYLGFRAPSPQVPECL